MNTTIPDLWPDDIKIDVLPPLAILKAQEGSLTRRTQGMLEAKLTTMESGDLVQHQLDLIAPSLNFYRERLLTATHNRLKPYPVTVEAVCFREKPKTHREALILQTKDPLDQLLPVQEAATDEEFVQLVRRVLRSSEVRALISSLIARINQNNLEHHGNGAVEQEGQPDASHGGN